MWDWRNPINNIRDEVRKARTNGDVAASLDDIDKLLDELSSVYERLEAEDNKSDVKDDTEFRDFIHKQKEVITNSYEHAKQYSNIIILGGYAGLFALWNFTREYLAAWQALSTGLLILVSLVIYIAFELYSSWLRATQINNQVKELTEAERLGEFPEEYGKAEMLRANRFMVIWHYYFFGAVAFALGATLILLFSFICHLMDAYV
ncbi:hypothetical protein [Kangiella sp. M94]